MTDTTTTAEATLPEQAAPPEEKTWPEALGANRIADMLAELTAPAAAAVS
ncbi:MULTISPECIES: hypothetical protein [Streptomyces]|uniref:Uncharacterized protein n=2 Tax=Streptomyces TaxID=1883 RepID=A0A1D8FW61_9ACTN|nr:MULTISPECIES: hypothetical protein [Streptomyces]AOT57447.1 hypothetical protein A4G23_00234 [Streptomyces rubrolavendulae]KAF0646890.1 hypothetical protein K701_26145 [Streptomyces fradiae ATCC 10745 = DSM 40063]OSY51584.1 hypothetical protein BG846_02795 [Streptomyces fradiae ATCC 10745 = DSM 40063]